MRYVRLTVFAAMAVLAACDNKTDEVGTPSDAVPSPQANGAPARSFMGFKPAPGNSAVRIVGTSPDVGTVLKAGQRVKFEVSAEYTLDADNGTVALVVQSASNDLLAQDLAVITRGSGSATLSAEIVVPDTKAIQVFTPLQAQDQVGTMTVQMRAFKVEPG